MYHCIFTSPGPATDLYADFIACTGSALLLFGHISQQTTVSRSFRDLFDAAAAECGLCLSSVVSELYIC